jgi:dipeptide/tripeptide permease
MIWLLFAFYGLFYGLTEGVEKALLADIAAPAERGAAFGWYNSAIGIGALPASLIFGFIWQRQSSFAAFGFGAALALHGGTPPFIPGKAATCHPVVTRKWQLSSPHEKTEVVSNLMGQLSVKALWGREHFGTFGRLEHNGRHGYPGCAWTSAYVVC